jgi:hypothetical membrane protein
LREQRRRIVPAVVVAVLFGVVVALITSRRMRSAAPSVDRTGEPQRDLTPADELVPEEPVSIVAAAIDDVPPAPGIAPAAAPDPEPAPVSIPRQASDARTIERTTRFLAACGIAGQLIFLALWVTWGFLEPDYDIVRQDISDFGALTASHPLPYNIVLSLTGLLTALFAIGLHRALGRGIAVILGAGLVAVFGVGMFIDGIVREDCSPSKSPSCRSALDAGALSWRHKAHDVESIITIAALILAPLALAYVFRQRALWQRLWLYSLATGIGVAVSFGVYLYIFSNKGNGNGIVERSLVTIGTAWLAVVGWRLWVVSSATASREADAISSLTGDAG